MLAADQSQEGLLEADRTRYQVAGANGASVLQPNTDRFAVLEDDLLHAVL
jgi:hypothetical protein